MVPTLPRAAVMETETDALPRQTDAAGLHERQQSTPVAISAVMPCLDEERALALCIEKAFRSFVELGLNGEVVVADNGSTDRSVEIAKRLGARVVHERRKG